MYLVDDTGGRRMDPVPPCDCPDCKAEQTFSPERQRDNWQLEDELLEELNDGGIWSFSKLQSFIAEHHKDLNRLWAEEHELLSVQFGMNDGDLDFTVTAVFETPFRV